MDTRAFHEPVLVYDRIDANRRKTVLFLCVFALVLLPFALYFGHQLTGMLALGILPFLVGWDTMANEPYAVMAIAAVVSLVLITAATLLTYRHSTRLVLRVAHARPMMPSEGKEFRRVVDNLCIGAGLPPPALAVIDADATNAFSTGLDPERSSLVVTQGLLDALDQRELEGVVAQELSQIGNYDVRLNTVVAGFVTLMWLPLSGLKALLRGARLLQRTVAVPPAGCVLGCLFLGFPLIGGLIAIVWAVISLLGEDPAVGILILGLMLLPLYFVFGAPMIGTLLLRGISREREFLADADAALLARNPAGLARALAKIGTAKNGELNVNPATAHLYIVNPLVTTDSSWDRFTSSHPPVGERIEMLARMGGITPEMVERAQQEGVEYRRTLEEGKDA